MKQALEQMEQSILRAFENESYTIKGTTPFVVIFNVEGYSFSFWMANGKSGFGLYADDRCVNFQMSKKTAQAIGKALTPIYNEGIINKEIAKHQGKINSLKKQLKEG